MSNSLRIVILTTRLPEDIWLINNLADVCSIEGIVFPLKKRWGEFGIINVVKKRIRRFGFFALADQALLVLYRLFFERGRDKKSLAAIFDHKPYDRIEREDIDILEVNDINSEDVRNFIRSKRPDVVVVSGTPLLKEHIIQSAEGRMINLHPGFAPQYRGRYGAFWPIYNKEPELVGTTIHFIDKGIDTGAILVQEKAVYNRDDTLKTVTYKQHKLGVRLLAQCLADFNSFTAQAYHKTGCQSKNYHAPGLTHYLKAKRWLKKTASSTGSH